MCTVYARYNGDFGKLAILRYIEILRYSYLLAGVKGQIQPKLMKGWVKFAQKYRIIRSQMSK